MALYSAHTLQGDVCGTVASTNIIIKGPGKFTMKDKDKSITPKQITANLEPYHGPLARYVRLRVAHATGMPGSFSLPRTSKENASKRSWYASRHVLHVRAVMHAGIADPWRRGKRSRHSRRMRNAQFFVYGKRPIKTYCALRSAQF